MIQEQVRFPEIRPPPQPLRDLLEDQTRKGKVFHEKIRMYNNALTFTSVGAKIDQSMAQGCVHISAARRDV
ncbi:hypothetical protein PsorP6_014982 [Peronosclerospora sorghi]|uniref:Uncharacterized protein n=1 Tax=Peronosclerospora sorghi TaxID=230839 RepID=A0ACC0VRJ1_9STRA|nr:hypothetical protein PsorP6_014982 [Peronosclerospora sorghi]